MAAMECERRVASGERVRALARDVKRRQTVGWWCTQPNGHWQSDVCDQVERTDRPTDGKQKRRVSIIRCHKMEFSANSFVLFSVVVVAVVVTTPLSLHVARLVSLSLSLLNSFKLLMHCTCVLVSWCKLHTVAAVALTVDGWKPKSH